MEDWERNIKWGTIMICPFCKKIFIGIEGSRICKNINCGAYEVDEDNYDVLLKDRYDLYYTDRKEIRKGV